MWCTCTSKPSFIFYSVCHSDASIAHNSQDKQSMTSHTTYVDWLLPLQVLHLNVVCLPIPTILHWAKVYTYWEGIFPFPPTFPDPEQNSRLFTDFPTSWEPRVFYSSRINVITFPQHWLRHQFSRQSTLRKLGSLATHLKGKIEETLGKTALWSIYRCSKL